MLDLGGVSWEVTEIVFEGRIHGMCETEHRLLPLRAGITWCRRVVNLRS